MPLEKPDNSVFTDKIRQKLKAEFDTPAERIGRLTQLLLNQQHILDLQGELLKTLVGRVCELETQVKLLGPVRNTGSNDN